MEKISIIVPVYQVEKYLEKNINSLINQTYKNIEIILVDDGSKDNSGKICDKYAAIDSRIIVIHKKNGGLSDARNVGIEKSTGSYLTFIDSDDYVSTHYCEILYNCLKANKADIAICRYKKFKEEQECKEIIDLNTKEMNSIDSLNSLFSSDHDFVVTMSVAWGKLYKKCLFKNIKYPVGKIHEDDFVIHHIYGIAKKIVLVKSVLYFYLQRNNSIMGEKFSLKHLDALEACQDKITYFKNSKLYDLSEKSCKLYNELIKEYYFLYDNQDTKKALKAKLLPLRSYKKQLTLKNIITHFIFKYLPFIYKILK